MPITLFVCLQALDFLTTMLGLRLGASEASPLVRALMCWGADPALSVAACKILAFALAGSCFWLHRPRVIRWINNWYAALVAWNIITIVRLVAQAG